MIEKERKMNKTIGYFIVIVLLCAVFSGCGTYTKMVRDEYPKISGISKVTNNDKFVKSSFKNYFMYKTSLKCDFDLLYFLSYSYHYSSQYTSTDIDIYSTVLFQGNYVSTLGNIFDNAYVKKNSNITATSYLILDESVISKKIALELSFTMNDIKPGRLRGTTSDRSASLVLRDRDGKILFDISDSKSYVAVEIVSVENNIAYGKFQAQLVGHKKELYLGIQEGEFWLKI
jgi:hypothetical protein